jgi:hypothetical protein
MNVRAALLFPLVPALFGLAAPQATFETAVTPVLRRNCGVCHNDTTVAGGLSMDRFTGAESIAGNREAWERIVAKLRSGEMPPKGAPRPAETDIQELVRWVGREFDRLDRARPPDPGRIVARRLTRAEYANTVRDLLGVRFRAGEEFPADDAILGFDNIGDVLTVSPFLMEKYVYAAERIASLAIGADPLPKATLVEHKTDVVRRVDAGATESSDHFDYTGEYVFRAWVRGHLGPNGQPVELRLSVDGKPVRTAEIATRENETSTVARDVQRAKEEARVYLTAGVHTFRAELVGDEFRKPVPRAPARRPPGQPDNSMYPDKFDLLGPFAAKGDHPPRTRILTCDPATGPACIERILAPLARLAYRRPVTKADVVQLADVARKAAQTGFTPAQAVQFALQAMLVSPHFLLKIERDPKGAYGPVSDLELATRLSYFLWSSMPDEELLGLAERGKLRSAGVLDAQITRMLADRRSEALAQNFAGQWLEIRSLAAVKPDVLKFPMWSAALQEDMATETRLFFDHILRENRPVSEFLAADYTFLNARLARHYGIEGVDGAEFRKVKVDPAQRGGVLTHGSVLTITSYPVRTSPVLRGKYILEVLLGAAPPPPPGDVPQLEENAAGAPASLRVALERHRADPTCASCHVRMDPLGFGLENYDPIGRYRTEENKAPIQAGGRLPNGVEFSSPAQLKAILEKDLPDVARNLAEKMMIYALGRGLEPYDRLPIREIVGKMEQSEFRFQTLIRGIVASLPFQARRGQVKNVTDVAGKR